MTNLALSLPRVFFVPFRRPNFNSLWAPPPPADGYILMEEEAVLTQYEPSLEKGGQQDQLWTEDA